VQSYRARLRGGRALIHACRGSQSAQALHGVPQDNLYAISAIGCWRKWPVGGNHRATINRMVEYVVGMDLRQYAGKWRNVTWVTDE